MMNAKTQISNKTKSYVLRVILALALSFAVGAIGKGHTLQAAAEGLALTETRGSLAVGTHIISDLKSVPAQSIPILSTSGYYSTGMLTVSSAATPPANDDFPGTPITSIPFTDSNVDTTNATTAGEDPTSIVYGDCDSNQGLASVWYHYNPGNQNKYVNFDTIGSNYDTVVAVWTGTAPYLVLVACNDDISLNDLQSKVRVLALANTDYFIEIIEFTQPTPQAQAETRNLNFHAVEGIPQLKQSRDAVNFGNQLYWIKSDPQNIILTNEQPTDVHVGNFARSSGQFLLASNNCANHTLTPGQSCSFKLIFKPTVIGSLSGTLTIHSDAANQPNIISLNGTGIGGTQLLVDKSFELDANNNNLPDSWSVSGLMPNDVRDNQYAKSGVYSWRLVGNSISSKNIKQITYKTGSAGDDFLFVMWSKAYNVPSGWYYRTQISFYNGNTLVHRRIKDYMPGTHDWEYKWLPITVPSPYTRIEIEIIYTLPWGQAWFDSASLKWAP